MSLRRPPPPIPQKPKRLQSSELPVADNERPVSPQDTGPGRRVSVSALRNMFEANQDDSSSSIPPVPAIPKSRSSIVPFPSLTVTNPSQQIETPLVDSDNPFLADEEVNSKIPNRIISPNPPQNAPPLIRRPIHRSLSHSSVSNIFDDPNLVVMSPATDVPPSPRPQSTVHQLAVKLEISTNLQSSHIPSMRHESSINSPYHNSKLDSPSLAQSKYLSPVPQTPGSKSMTRSSSFSTIEEIHSQEKKEKEGAELDMLAENVKKHKKRFNLTLELLNTELAYLQDIKLLDEVYCRPSTELKIFSAADSKAIFTNLPDVISCSEEFAEILKASTGGLVNANGEIVEEPDEKWIWSDWDRDDHFCWVGEAFLQMMTKLEDVYCDYCTRHEVSLGKLAELSKGSNPQIIKFLKEAREKIQGRTTSWDLASMLIKPVQRVLKYPLLLKQILALTPSVHPDYPHLEKALAGIENVAEKINEIKKRKELVEKIVTGDKEVNIRHGITKNLTRTKQQLKQATGLSMDVAVDDLYASVEEKFNFQKTQAQTFISDIITWLSSLKQFFNQLHDLAISLEDLYTAFSPPRSSSSSPLPNFSKVTIPRSAEFRKFAGKLGLEMTQQMEKSLRDKLFPIFEKMMGLFDNPATVMKKRDRKFLDYMSVKEITNKGETPDKTLLESADAYSAINAQLIDELPKFFALQEQFFDIVVIQFVSIQATFYRSYQDQILQVLSHGLQDIDKMVLMTEMKNEEVRECWERKFSSVKPMVDEIEVMGLAKEMREKGKHGKSASRQPTRSNTNESLRPPSSVVESELINLGTGSRNAPPRRRRSHSASDSPTSSNRTSVVSSNHASSYSSVKVGNLIDFDDSLTIPAATRSSTYSSNPFEEPEDSKPSGLPAPLVPTSSSSSWVDMQNQPRPRSSSIKQSQIVQPASPSSSQGQNLQFRRQSQPQYNNSKSLLVPSDTTKPTMSKSKSTDIVSLLSPTSPIDYSFFKQPSSQPASTKINQVNYTATVIYPFRGSKSDEISVVSFGSMVLVKTEEWKGTNLERCFIESGDRKGWIDGKYLEKI